MDSIAIVWFHEDSSQHDCHFGSFSSIILKLYHICGANPSTKYVFGAFILTLSLIYWYYQKHWIIEVSWRISYSSSGLNIGMSNSMLWFFQLSTTTTVTMTLGRIFFFFCKLAQTLFYKRALTINRVLDNISSPWWSDWQSGVLLEGWANRKSKSLNGLFTF